MLIMTEDPEWGIHKAMFDNLRVILRQHQKHLMEHPNPQDPWWFLIDPDAENNPWD